MRIVIILFLGLLIACSNEKNHEENHNENIIESKYMNNSKLQLIDSVRFNSNAAELIGDILHGYKCSGYYMFPDGINKSVHIFDKEYNYLSRIGGKGKGPGEFLHPPVIIINRKSIELVNVISKKIYNYNEEFKFISESFLPSDLQYIFFSPIKLLDNYIFSSVFPGSYAKDEYFLNYKSLVVINKNYKIKENFYEYNDVYKDNSSITFAKTNFGNLLALGSKGYFYSNQNATFLITKFDSNLNEIITFGKKPKYYMVPQDNVSFEKLQSSYELLLNFKASSTIISKIDFDIDSKLFFLFYKNPSRDAYIKRDSQLFEKYLMIFNEQYDCIFDEKIVGEFLYSDSGEIHILDHKSENIYNIKKYNVKFK
jgi:hypothetical protein